MTINEVPLSWLPLADAVVKASLVLGAAALMSLILRRASAALRHLVWTLALCSALFLPVVSLMLPKWQLKLVTIAVSRSGGRDDGGGLSLLNLRPPRLAKRRDSVAPPHCASHSGTTPALPHAQRGSRRCPGRRALGIWLLGAAPSRPHRRRPDCRCDSCPAALS
jgi:hypothetical protein